MSILLSFCFAAPPLNTDLSPQPAPTYDGTQLLVAPGLPLSLQEAAGQVIVFKGSEIRQSGYSDITDFLEKLPNIFTERYYNRPGPVTKTFLQSSQPNDINVYVDDIPINNLYDGIADLNSIPLEDIVTVEVYPGSSAIACGSDGTGGMVRINTRQGRLERASSWICFTDSTFDRERYKMDFGNSFSFMDMRISGSREISTGWIWNARSRMSNINGYTKFFPDSPINITLQGNRFGRYQELPGPMAEEDVYALATYYQDEIRYDMEGRLDWEITRGSDLSLRYLLGQEDRTLIQPRLHGSRDQGIRQEPVLGYRQLWDRNGFSLESGLTDWSSSGAASDKFNLSRELIHYGDRQNEPWAKLTFLLMPGAGFTIMPAIKYNHCAGTNRYDPGADVGWQPVEGLMFYIRGGSGYHRYLPRERAIDGAPQLSSSLGGEAGIKARHPWRGEAGISGYYRSEKDRPEEGSYIVHDRAILTGGGAWFSFNPWIPDLIFFASAGMDKSQADGRDLPMIPQQRVHSRIDYSLPFFDGDLRLGAAIESDFVGRRAFVNTASDPYAPYYSRLGTYSTINFLGYIQLLQARGFANFYNLTNNESRVVIPGYKSPGYEMAIGVTWQLFD